MSALDVSQAGNRKELRILHSRFRSWSCNFVTSFGTWPGSKRKLISEPNICPRSRLRFVSKAWIPAISWELSCSSFPSRCLRCWWRWVPLRATRQELKILEQRRVNGVSGMVSWGLCRRKIWMQSEPWSKREKNRVGSMLVSNSALASLF